ncbi:MAG: hypothetical protein JWP84_2638 [Tardiphaga sp.]|nr:hypothetical protein [Tardiphaga sp.]
MTDKHPKHRSGIIDPLRANDHETSESEQFSLGA